jgi:hypothetical protein
MAEHWAGRCEAAVGEAAVGEAAVGEAAVDDAAGCGAAACGTPGPWPIGRPEHGRSGRRSTADAADQAR